MQEEKISNNIRNIQSALKDCHYIIDHYETSEQFEISPKTNRQVMVDYKVTIYPTKVFQDEQYRLNSHYKNIQEHRTTTEGKVVIKPMRDQYPGRSSFNEYLHDKAEFDSAHGKKTTNQ